MKNKHNDWIFFDKDRWIKVKEPMPGYAGFVYKIDNNENGRVYIGQKVWWNKKTLPPLKGRKNKRHTLVESSWKSYWGSSKELLADIEEYGEDNFTRIILKPCLSKGDLSYYELKEQLRYDALLDPNYYNGIINVRINRTSLKEPIMKFMQRNKI